jgi:capsular polysaccharide biosynthesis protein
MGTGDWLATPDTLTKGQVGGTWGKILGVLGVIRKRDVFVFIVAVLTAAQLPLIAFFLLAVGTYASFVGILVNDIRIGKMQD